MQNTEILLKENRKLKKLLRKLNQRGRGDKKRKKRAKRGKSENSYKETLKKGRKMRDKRVKKNQEILIQMNYQKKKSREKRSRLNSNSDAIKMSRREKFSNFKILNFPLKKKTIISSQEKVRKRVIFKRRKERMN